jgi:hypothetical protein
MPQSITVTIADRTYTISQLPMKSNAAWRKRVQESHLLGIFSNLDDVIQDAIRFFDARSEGRMADLNVNEFMGTLMAIPSIVRKLTGSMDEIIELVFAYSPELRKERPYIEEHAYDDEIMGVFVRIVPLAFPYTGLLGLVRGGSQKATSTNLPSANGVTGLSKEGPKKRTSTSS